MKEFFTENWTEILSIVGALAWIPILFCPIINYLRVMQGTLLDCKILTNGKGVSAGQKEKKQGTILMIAINLFINKVTIFAKFISIKVKLKNGAVLNTELLDFSTLESNNDDSTKSVFMVPIEYELNVSRTIHCNVDNIKFVSFLVESASFSSIDEVDEIVMRFYYFGNRCKLFSKKVTLVSSEFPRFNTSGLIRQVEKVLET